MIDACRRLGGTADARYTGDLRGDLHAFLSGLAEQLQAASWSAVVPSIVDAAERDGDVLAMQTEWHRALMAPFGAMVERAKARGEAGADADSQAMIATTVGALFYRRWFSREPIDARFVNAVVSAVVTVITQ